MELGDTFHNYTIGNFRWRLPIDDAHRNFDNHQFDSHKGYFQLGTNLEGHFAFTCIGMGNKTNMDNSEREIRRFNHEIKFVLNS